jgi:heme-degrading monooxygenase HmoA
MMLIKVFEVPPEADAAFVPAWERARDFLRTTDDFIAAALHRAVRSDAEFRFVGVTSFASAEGGQRAMGDPELPRGTEAFEVHSGLYEVVHEDGVVEGAGGVILINPLEVPAGEEERFLTGWQRAHETFADQRGYLGTRLHRSLGESDFRFVDLARWSSPLAFARALRQPELAASAAAPPFASHPTLYQVVGD